MGYVIGRDGKPVPNSDVDNQAEHGMAGDGDREAIRPNRSVDSRFKPGNKHGKGRPKGSPNMRTIVRRAVDAKVSAKFDGKVQKVTKKELAVHQVVNQAAAGNLQAFDRSTALQERYYPQEESSGPTLKDLKPDIDTLRHYLAWHDLLDPPASDDGDSEESGND